MKRGFPVCHQLHQQLVGLLGGGRRVGLRGAPLTQERLDLGQLGDGVVDLPVGAPGVGPDRDQILLGAERGKRLAQARPQRPARRGW